MKLVPFSARKETGAARISERLKQQPRDGENMKISAIFLLFLGLTSCAHIQEPRTLAEVKENWDCLRYEPGVGWKQVTSTLAEPDVTPLPEPGTDLGRNARVFTGKVIVFYLERREVQEGGRTRFQEVVTDLDLCAKKK